MKPSEYDIFSIREYSFSVNKTNSYFSLVSIILTCLILTLSILVNYQTVSYLWLQRKDMPLGLSESLSLPNPFTSALVCYTSNHTIGGGGSIPKVIFYNSIGLEITFPSVSEEQLRKDRPSLAAQITSPFGCANIADYNFTQLNSYIVIGINAQSASLFVEVINQQQLLLNKGSSFKKLQSIPYAGTGLTFRTINSAIKDTVELNAQYEIRNMIYNEQQPEFITPYYSDGADYSKFLLQLYIPISISKKQLSWNKLTVSITCLDFGYIVGAIISWISIFTLIAGIIVFPIMEKSFILLQIQKLFHLQTKFQSPSLAKFIISSFKKGIFAKEDYYVRLAQRISIMKNIGFILKTQKTLKKLCYSTPQKRQIFACQNNFKQVKQQSQIPYFSQPNQTVHFHQNMNKTQEKPKNILSQLMRNVLCLFDMRQDKISINYKKPHGSSESLCISTLFFIAFMIFLYVFGVFETSKSIQIYESKIYKRTEFQFKYNQILFATYGPQQILVELIDGNLKTIRNLTLSSSANCLRDLSSDQLSQIGIYGQYVYCFEQNIVLAHSSEKSEIISLYINNINFENYLIWLLHFPNHTINSYYNPLYYVFPIFPSTQFNNSFLQKSKIKLTQFINSEQKVTVSQIGIMDLVPSNYKNRFGANIVLNSFQTTVSQKTSTFFDVIQNIWGFATIFFGFLLTKITKYINIHKKNRKINKQKAEYKEDICILLSKVNQINNGRHNQQLLRMKYFVKASIFDL